MDKTSWTYSINLFICHYVTVIVSNLHFMDFYGLNRIYLPQNDWDILLKKHVL